MSHEVIKIADPIKYELAGQAGKVLESLAGSSAHSGLLSGGVIASMMTRPPESDMGDYALPCFRFAKDLRKKPADVASALKELLEKNPHPLVRKVEQAGAFLNFFLETGAFAAYLVPSLLNGSYFSRLKENLSHTGTRVMIEYSQPNTHKEFHIGHGRNVSLGDSVARIFAYNGYQVLPVNYIGDEGTHVAKCLWQVKEAFDAGEKAPTEKFTEWYGRRYVEANQKLQDADESTKPVYLAKISAILAEIEAKSGYFYDLWKKSRAECLKDFEKIYSWLGARFDHIFFESDVSEESQKIVDELLAKGLFSESDGAIGVSLEEHSLGYFMARKSDGTSLYITKDLALARKKFEEFAIDRSVYVVGCEQNFHFRQLFRVLDMMGFSQSEKCYHLSYAHVTLPEGKISSRKGNAFTFNKLADLIQSEVSKHLEKYKGQWSPQEIQETARVLSVAAIKYGMLASDSQKEIVFDPASWTSFDGNSGPYLLYSYSRIQSVLRECHKAGFEASGEYLNLLSSPFEGELLVSLYDFNTQVVNACELYKPSVIANYLFGLSKSFNRFYANVSVLRAESQELRSARMALIKSCGMVLSQGLNLLGIETAERM